MKSKKGAIGVSLDTIIGLSVTALVLMMWFGFYLLVTSDTVTEQKNAALTQSSMIQLAMSAPYDTDLYGYSRNLWFAYDFSKNYVAVQDRTIATRIRQAQRYDFVSNGGIDFYGAEFRPKDQSIGDQLKGDVLKSGGTVPQAYSAKFHLCKKEREVRVAEECDI